MFKGQQIVTTVKWKQIKWKFMLQILREKLKVSPEYMDFLLSSRHDVLVENTTNEYWGKGSEGRGRNMLGVLHTLLRGELFYSLIPSHSN